MAVVAIFQPVGLDDFTPFALYSLYVSYFWQTVYAKKHQLI